MNAPVSVEIRASVVESHIWRQLLVPLTVGLILLGGVFNNEVVAAVSTWIASTAYNHCFLVIPIVLFLLWERRFDLAGSPARPMPAALLLGLPLAMAWLVAERLGIMEGRQLIAVSFVELLFLGVLGRRLWWAMAGPLLYLYFLVPFGAFLTPWLQDVTTAFIQHGLEILGVPAYIDGYVIEIPQGMFFVAEACAGLRFLIASIAFGCLYALVIYRSPVRRGAFILASTVVPIIANGLRATGIVYLGYRLGSAQAAATDHVLYGWLFFSAVILLLIGLGLPFRQDEISTRSKGLLTKRTDPTVSTSGILVLVLEMVAMAALSPTIAAGMTMGAPKPAVAPSSIEVGPDCVMEATVPGVDSMVREQRLVWRGVEMDMRWEAFSSRSTAGTVMTERRRLVSRAMTEGLSESWLASGHQDDSAWRILHSNNPAYIMAVLVLVDGQPVRPGLTMRLRMALNSLTGSAYAPMVVTVTPVVDWSSRDIAVIRNAEASLPAFLQAHARLDHTIGVLSALP